MKRLTVVFMVLVLCLFLAYTTVVAQEVAPKDTAAAKAANDTVSAQVAMPKDTVAAQAVPPKDTVAAKAAEPKGVKAFSFGIGADVTFPASELKNDVATGYGATALVRFDLLPIVDLTGGVEYLKFGSKTTTVNNVSEESKASAWGFLIGGRVNILMLYGGVETGAYSFSKTIAGKDESVTRGILVPMVGVELGPFDLSGRYVSAGDDSFWGLRGLIWF